jgi:hypothetical protein
VFLDRNSNGLTDDGGPALAGWTVYLDADGDGQLDAGETSTTTDASGQYTFANLAPGTHVVRHVVNSRYVNVAPSGAAHTVQLAAGQSASDRNFGNFPTFFGNTPILRDRYTVRRSGDTIEIIDASTPTQVTYTIPAALLPTLEFNTGDGGDALTVDLSGGDPFPAGGISYDGGDNSSNTLTIVGTDAADSIDVGTTSVTVAGHTIPIANVTDVNVDDGGGDDVLVVGADRRSTLLGDGTYGSLTFGDGARVFRTGSGTVIRTNNLAMSPTAQLNLFANQLVVVGGDLEAITQLVASGRNSGTSRWRGNGINSTTAAQSLSGLTGLAVAQVGDDVVVKYSWNGDANVDGIIDADDYFRIDSGFLSQPANPGYAQGNFNYDAGIDADDYFLIDSAFLGQTGMLAQPPAATAAVATTAKVEVVSAETTASSRSTKSGSKRPVSSLFSTTRVGRKMARHAARRPFVDGRS